MLSPITFSVRELSHLHRAEVTCEGGFLVIRAGRWHEDKTDAESDLTEFIEHEREKHELQSVQEQKRGPRDGDWPNG